MMRVIVNGWVFYSAGFLAFRFRFLGISDLGSGGVASILSSSASNLALFTTALSSVFKSSYILSETVIIRKRCAQSVGEFRYSILIYNPRLEQGNRMIGE